MEKKTKTEALIKAKNALKAYLKEHNLNPIYDWREDKVHGIEVTRLVTRLNLERDKVLDKYPYEDIPNETKLVKMKKAKEKALKEKKAAKAVEAPKKEKKVSISKKYDYPLIDGREMTTDEKKKYRAEQRRLQNKDAKPKKEKATKADAKSPKKEKAAEAPKKEKKVKKEAVPEKPLKEKKAKKVKKIKKVEED